MVYEHKYHGLNGQTGDLLCMTDGDQDSLQGHFWRLLGTLLPGPIDHIVIYLGPDGRCIEAGPAGITSFEMVGPTWFAKPLPNLFIWWDPATKEAISSPDYAYPRYATEAVGNLLWLGC